MKSVIKSISILILSIFVISCSETEELKVADFKGISKDNKLNKLYKKSESKLNGETIISQEVFYGKNYKIDSVVRNNIGYFKEIFRVGYKGNNVSSIAYTYDYEDESFNDINYSYQVSNNNNSITLTSSSSKIQIYHTNGFVDLTESSYAEDGFNNIYRQSFIRNEDDQLNSNSEISSSNNEQVYFYLDFDSNKKPAPLNSVIEIPNNQSILYFILGLKLSKDNPLAIDILPFHDTYSMTLDYDEDGYVTQGIFDNDFSFVEVHEYINQ